MTNVNPGGKPLFVLHGTIKTPPMSASARVEVGHLLRRVQTGELLSMPISRPMPAIGSGCHELRVTDEAGVEWRVLYHIDDAAILVLDVFRKSTGTTPENVKTACRDRLRRYLVAKAGG